MPVAVHRLAEVALNIYIVRLPSCKLSLLIDWSNPLDSTDTLFLRLAGGRFIAQITCRCALR